MSTADIQTRAADWVNQHRDSGDWTAEDQAALDAWLGSVDVRPGGDGESFKDVETRVLAALQRILDAHHGKTVVVVSHVTPIKTLVAQALDAPLLSVFRMELAPASVSVVSFYGDGRASLRSFNTRAPEAAAFDGPHRW